MSHSVAKILFATISRGHFLQVQKQPEVPQSEAEGGFWQ